jgi:hypothetical protein
MPVSNELQVDVVINNFIYVKELAIVKQELLKEYSYLLRKQAEWESVIGV